MNELPAEVIEKLALLPPMSKKVDQIHLAMYGNGNPEKGVLMISREHDTRIIALESANKTIKRGWGSILRWVGGVGTAVILILLGRWIG